MDYMLTLAKDSCAWWGEGKGNEVSTRGGISNEKAALGVVCRSSLSFLQLPDLFSSV